MKGFIVFSLALALSAPLMAAPAHGEEGHVHSASEESQFSLDNNLVDDIFKQTTEEQAIPMGRATANVTVELGLSYLSTSELSLTNQYFEVGYGEGFSGIPSVQLSVAKPLATWRYAQLLVLGRVGYGRKEALTQVRSASGGTFRDMLQLNWLPATAGLRSQFFPESTQVRPFLELSGGVQWLYQSGKLDKALEQGYWIPHYRVSLGTTLFGSNNSTTDWFGGVVASASLYRSFQSTQKMNGWSADLGLSILL